MTEDPQKKIRRLKRELKEREGQWRSEILKRAAIEKAVDDYLSSARRLRELLKIEKE